MSETDGYRAFVEAIESLPAETVVYFRDISDPIEAMTPARVLSEPEFVRYPGVRHAFPVRDLPPSSILASEIAQLGIRDPVIWHVTRGEPTATVFWEHTV